ncbi:hypothetical protein FisN_20Lh142 [Fistulifera solaris]|uniref:Uncharacterized protein n=1 Tax=Fistulifera solaris TaxID=1519565 RepID=A0A1Z5KRB6_FISSO|nr:hypothetical protein FisN_20Lh142 [Fistulifera solaris]|eukprot:GAX28846.1 hypothetical protein FisN_20Lh142 [Fistulifera solaris]
MEQIGSAIAPVLAVDDGEYSDDEYEEEEEDEYYNEDDEEEPGQPGSSAPFGFVGMITKALDREQKVYNDTHPRLNFDEEEEEVIDLIPLEENDSQQQQNKNVMKQDWSESSYVPTPHIPAKDLQVNEQYPISPSSKLRHASQLMIATDESKEKFVSDNIRSQQDVDLAGTNDSPPTHSLKPSMPSPNHPPSNLQNPITRSPSEQRSPATSKVMMPTEEPRRPSLIREKGSVSPNTPKVTKPVARPPSQSNSTEKIVELDSPVRQRPPFLYAPPLSASSEDEGGEEDDDDEEEEEKETKDDASSTRLAKEAIDAQQHQQELPQSNSVVTSCSESSLSPGHKQRHAFKLPPPLPSPNHFKAPAPPEHQPAPKVPLCHDTKEMEELRRHCQTLEHQLKQTESQVQSLRKQIKESSTSNHDEALYIQFQEKEARLLEAAAEEHQQQLNLLRGELEGKLGAIQRQLKGEQVEHQEEKQKLYRQLEDALRRAETVERESKRTQARQEIELSNKARALEHSLRISEDKLARSMALLDEREEEMAALKKNLKTLQSTMTEHREGAEEVEEEMDELHAENESLRQHVEVLEAQCTQLKMKVEELQADTEKLTALKLELRMLREDRDRDLAKIQSVAETTSATSAQLESERAALIAEVHDLKRQLTAARADIDLARADTERVITANANLQHALEAFQSERDAELALLEDQRRDMEEAMVAAHAAALEATHEAHEADIRRIRLEANEEVAKVRMEVTKLEEKNDLLRADNVQMRRSS